jgi:hypothetical protein
MAMVTTLGSTTVTIAPPDEAPFPVQAVVEEQDTCLILDIEPVIRKPMESFPRLVRQANEQRPRTPGEVVVRPGSPMRLLAVVHDLEREPSCKESWINDALLNVLRQLGRHRVNAAALPLLGTVHGHFNGMRFVRLLRDALHSHTSSYPKKLWLIAPEGDCEWIAKYLEKSEA